MVDPIPDVLRGLGEKDKLSVLGMIDVVSMELIFVETFGFLICFEFRILRCTGCPFGVVLNHHLDLLLLVPDLLFGSKVVHPVLSCYRKDIAKGLFRPKFESDRIVVGV